jgi:hypothetical protein
MNSQPQQQPKIITHMMWVFCATPEQAHKVAGLLDKKLEFETHKGDTKLSLLWHKNGEYEKGTVTYETATPLADEVIVAVTKKLFRKYQVSCDYMINRVLFRGWCR